MKRMLGAVAIIALFAACGTNAAQEQRRILGDIERAQSNPHGFKYVDQTLDGSDSIVVEGSASDDFRYDGTVSHNGKKLYRMIVSDDAVALQLIDRAATKSVVDYATRLDPVTGQALADGKWVVDFAGAPALNVVKVAKGDTEQGTAAQPQASRAVNPIGDDPFFDAADALHYTLRTIGGGFGMAAFNPDDVEYNPADDPWKDDAQKNLRGQGIRRYDLRQAPLPGRAQRGATQRLPGAAAFRKMAIYVRGSSAFEIKEQISLRDRREFRRAEEGRAAKYYLQLRDAALGGALASPLRERKMTLDIEPFDGAPIVVPGDAVKGILKDVIGERGLKSLFKFKVIGQNTGGVAVLPGVGQLYRSPAPSAAAPSSSSAPAPSGAGSPSP